MLKKIVLIVRGILLALLIVGGGFSLAAYILDRDYFSKENIHYQNESIITESQAIYLASKYSVAYLGQIKPFEIQDDGSIKVKYDFYTDEKIDYLIPNDFSIFDSPGIYHAKKNFTDMWPTGIVLMVVLMLGFFGTIIMIALGKHKPIVNFLYEWFWKARHNNLKQAQFSGKTYLPKIVDVINIDSKKAGIFAVRTWKYSLAQGYLRSTYKHENWRSKTLIADKLPNEKNYHGIYAYRIGKIKHDYHSAMDDICGIVSLSGEYNEHEDGIIRAECCEIVCFILNKRFGENIAEHLSGTYGVPVYIADRPMIALEKWLLDVNGISCLLHNAEVAKEAIICGNKGASNQKGQDTLSETRRCATTRI